MAALVGPSLIPTRSVRSELHWLATNMHAPHRRTMREFAEQEIILPTGPFEGLRYNCDRQPFAKLWFDAHESGKWTRFAITAPSQQGKTLQGTVIPLCFHLFELGERVVFGLPDLDMWADKWRDDILPVIERTRYRDLLPKMGGGSRGGKVRSIKFRNGAVLRIMTGGGGDKARAGFTARVLVVTEVDGLDESSSTSREADKLKQLEKRVASYGARKRVYLECTVSVAKGRIWQEYIHGTRSRIALPCPHCGEFSTPEREHLFGWQDAENEHEARAMAHFVCPACAEPWTEDDRHQANRACRLVHEGQEIDQSGQVTGPLPPTDTLGFRWSAVNNMLVPACELGVGEWKAQREVSQDNAERDQHQFVWCNPYEPPFISDMPLEPVEVAKRCGDLLQGKLPADTKYVVVATDVGKWMCHYAVLCFRSSGGLYIPDYGIIDVHSDTMQEEAAVMAALRGFRDTMETGFVADGSAKLRLPDRCWIDQNYLTKTVKNFVAESGKGPVNRWMTSLGRGLSQMQKMRYRSPDKTSKNVRKIGDGWHIAWLPEDKIWQATVDADRWKLWMQQALRIAMDQPGAISVFSAGGNRHNKLAHHLCSEQFVREEKPGVGVVEHWERHGANHWGDAVYNACACLNFCGMQMVTPLSTPVAAAPAAAPRRMPILTPDGRPFMVTDRR